MGEVDARSPLRLFDDVLREDDEGAPERLGVCSHVNHARRLSASPRP